MGLAVMSAVVLPATLTTIVLLERIFAAITIHLATVTVLIRVMCVIKHDTTKLVLVFALEMGHDFVCLLGDQILVSSLQASLHAGRRRKTLASLLIDFVWTYSTQPSNEISLSLPPCFWSKYARAEHSGVL